MLGQQPAKPRPADAAWRDSSARYGTRTSRNQKQQPGEIYPVKMARRRASGGLRHLLVGTSQSTDRGMGIGVTHGELGVKLSRKAAMRSNCATGNCDVTPKTWTCGPGSRHQSGDFPQTCTPGKGPSTGRFGCTGGLSSAWPVLRHLKKSSQKSLDRTAIRNNPRFPT